MLLEWIDQLGLLKARSDRNILKDFPLGVKRVIVSEIVKYTARKYDEAMALLKTPTHIYFLMEIIGIFIIKN